MKVTLKIQEDNFQQEPSLLGAGKYPDACIYTYLLHYNV